MKRILLLVLIVFSGAACKAQNWFPAQYWKEKFWIGPSYSICYNVVSGTTHMLGSDIMFGGLYFNYSLSGSYTTTYGSSASKSIGFVKTVNLGADYTFYRNDSFSIDTFPYVTIANSLRKNEYQYKYDVLNAVGAGIGVCIHEGHMVVAIRAGTRESGLSMCYAFNGHKSKESYDARISLKHNR